MHFVLLSDPERCFITSSDFFGEKKKIRDVQEQRNRGLSEIESTMRSVSNCILVPLCPSLYELQSCTCQFVGDASGM